MTVHNVTCMLLVLPDVIVPAVIWRVPCCHAAVSVCCLTWCYTPHLAVTVPAIDAAIHILLPHSLRLVLAGMVAQAQCGTLHAVRTWRGSRPGCGSGRSCLSTRGRGWWGRSWQTLSTTR